jgi:predicted membrane protein
VEEVALPITVLYFWSFVIIAYFLLFNMVLAVIFTVYDAEYSGMKHEMKVEEEEKKRNAEELMHQTEVHKLK